MDKVGADVRVSLESIQKEFLVTPLLTQLNLGLEQDFEGLSLISSERKLMS